MINRYFKYVSLVQRRSTIIFCVVLAIVWVVDIGGAQIVE